MLKNYIKKYINKKGGLKNVSTNEIINIFNVHFEDYFKYLRKNWFYNKSIKFYKVNNTVFTIDSDYKPLDLKESRIDSLGGVKTMITETLCFDDFIMDLINGEYDNSHIYYFGMGYITTHFHFGGSIGGHSIMLTHKKLD